jgi:hypothetical protein
VAEALVFAARNRYTEADLITMQALNTALNSAALPEETAAP